MAVTFPLLKSLRDAAWLDDEPARVYRLMLAAILTAACVGWIALSRAGIDPMGKPLGTDFLSFWAASKLALGGHSTAAYDVVAHAAVQTAQFDAGQGYAAFFYPPVYLLLCLPLATLPFLPSLGLWLGLSAVAYAKVVHRHLQGWPGAWLTLLAFPAILVNLGNGQNGFITAALMGGGLLLLGRRPWLAGVLFGCLAIKPHLALLIPVSLAARGLWRPFISAGLTAMGLALVSLAAFGVETWQAFFANTTLARRTLETGLVDPAKMQSLFTAARVLGGDLGLAYGLQALGTACVAATLVVMAKARVDSGAQNAALAAGALIATPFVLDYDLTWTALPLAWLFVESRRTGPLPWERLAMGLAFVLPLFSRAVAMHLSLPIAPVVLIALFWAVARRGYASSPLPQGRGRSLKSSPFRRSRAGSGR